MAQTEARMGTESPNNGDIQDRATGVFFAVTLGAAALSLGAGLYAWHRSQNATAAPEQSPQTTQAARNTRNVLQYFLIPLWTAAGIADWLCHRASKIERTTGVKETALHLMMLGEAGLPVLIGLFFEINPLVLGLMISSFFVHEATAMWDVRYAGDGSQGDAPGTARTQLSRTGSVNGRIAGFAAALAAT